MTLSLTGSSEKENKDVSDSADTVNTTKNKEETNRSPTPVTVTHFSWGECGKLEQRVISPTRSPSPRSPTPFLSLSLTSQETPSIPNNPFNPFTSLSSEERTGTNPFLTPSNPFIESVEDFSKSENSNVEESSLPIEEIKIKENNELICMNGDLKRPISPKLAEDHLPSDKNKVVNTIANAKQLENSNGLDSTKKVSKVITI